MDYAAITFWLSVVVFTALGVHHLWSALIGPKIVNAVLLPGTLVATLGHVVGLLITGGTVQNTALITDSDSGEPQTGGDAKPRVPIIGSIVVALFPMLGCAIAIYAVASYLGSPVMSAIQSAGTHASARLVLPVSGASFFGMLHQVIHLSHRFVEAVLASDLTDWRNLLFLYLSICLTVRMAPLADNIRGVLGAIFLTGLAAFLFAQLTSSKATSFEAIWALVCFAVAVLSFLLIASLLITGAVHLIRTLFDAQ
jgi:hypothetical protein